MPKRKAGALPLEVRKSLDAAVEQLETFLWRITEGDLPEARKLDGALDEVVGVAYHVSKTKRADRPRIARIADFTSVIAERIREHRLKEGMTQASLAVALTRAGFDWKRITVAEVEAAASVNPDRRSGARRVTLEELLALAAIFRVPMVELMLPSPGREYLAWQQDRSLEASDVSELMLGRDGRIGVGGTTWAVADRVLGVRVDVAPKGVRRG